MILRFARSPDAPKMTIPHALGRRSKRFLTVTGWTAAMTGPLIYFLVVGANTAAPLTPAAFALSVIFTGWPPNSRRSAASTRRPKPLGSRDANRVNSDAVITGMGTPELMA